MTADDFRQLALSLPGASEGEHMGHADFRVAGRIFAGLSPDESHAMLKLPLDVQERLTGSAPDVYAPCKGAWGKAGATHMLLAEATRTQARSALAAAHTHASSAKPAKRRTRT